MATLARMIFAGARGLGTRTMNPATHCPASSFGIVPDHVSLRRQPFEPVVQTPVLTTVWPLRVIEGSWMGLAKPGQDLVEALGRSPAMAVRQARRRQRHQNAQKEGLRAHAAF